LGFCTSQVIGFEDRAFAPVKWLVLKTGLLHQSSDWFEDWAFAPVKWLVLKTGLLHQSSDWFWRPGFCTSQVIGFEECLWNDHCPSQATRAYGAALIFVSHSPQPDTSLHCEATNTGLVYHAACLFTPQLSLVPSYTAWWQRHIGVRNLPRVFTPKCLAETRTHDFWSQVR